MQDRRDDEQQPSTSAGTGGSRRHRRSDRDVSAYRLYATIDLTVADDADDNESVLGECTTQRPQLDWRVPPFDHTLAGMSRAAGVVDFTASDYYAQPQPVASRPRTYPWHRPVGLPSPPAAIPVPPPPAAIPVPPPPAAIPVSPPPAAVPVPTITVPAEPVVAIADPAEPFISWLRWDQPGHDDNYVDPTDAVDDDNSLSYSIASNTNQSSEQNDSSPLYNVPLQVGENTMVSLSSSLIANILKKPRPPVITLSELKNIGIKIVILDMKMRRPCAEIRSFEIQCRYTINSIKETLWTKPVPNRPLKLPLTLILFMPKNTKKKIICIRIRAIDALNKKGDFSLEKRILYNGC